MTSRQQKAKEAQGYVEKPVPETCANCKNYASDTDSVSYISRMSNEVRIKILREKNKRCLIGDFALKRKSGTCKVWAPKPD